MPKSKSHHGCKNIFLIDSFKIFLEGSFSEIFATVFQALKPLSVTTNVVGLQTDDADHAGQNSSAHVARVVGLQTDAVVVTETRFSRVVLCNFDLS